MTDIGRGFLLAQLGATLLYVVVTVPCFFTRRSHLLCFYGSWLVLTVFAVTIPWVALAQPAFWSYIGVSLALAIALLFYDDYLDARAPMKNREATLAFLVPVIYGGISLVLATSVHIVHGLLS